MGFVTDRGIIKKYYEEPGVMYIALQTPEGTREIGDSAFQYCMSPTEIVIAEGTERIGKKAFQYCHNLKRVVLPDSLREIDDQAFDFCENLKEIIGGTGLVRFGRDAVEKSSPWYVNQIRGNGVATLGSVLIRVSPESCLHCRVKEGIRVIADKAFEKHRALLTVTLPKSLSVIGNQAFQDCRSLTEVTLPEKLMMIGSGAFADCTALTTINLPQSVQFIGAEAFRGCAALTSAQIPPAIRQIPVSCFEGCRSLKSVTLPPDLNTIEKSAFEECGSLTAISLPETVTEIGDSVFRDCHALKDISIPAGVRHFGSEAFIGTPFLKEMREKDPFCIINGILIDARTCTGEVTVPETVTGFAEGIFSSVQINKIRLPRKQIPLPPRIFEGCPKLEAVTFPGGTVTLPSHDENTPFYADGRIWDELLTGKYVQRGLEPKLRPVLIDYYAATGDPDARSFLKHSRTEIVSYLIRQEDMPHLTRMLSFSGFYDNPRNFQRYLKDAITHTGNGGSAEPQMLLMRLVNELENKQRFQL